MPHARGFAHVGEVSRAVVAVEAVAGDSPVALARAVGVPDRGDEPVEVAVAVEVADRRTHAVLVVGDSVLLDQVEGSVLLVAQDLRGAEVGGDEQVRPAVVVDVGEVAGEGVVDVAALQGTAEDGDARRLAHVRELAAAIVAPKAPGGGRVRQGGAPARDEEVEVEVAIVIAEGRGVAVPGQREAGPRRQREGAVPAIQVEPRRRLEEAEQQEVEPAVAVDVGERAARDQAAHRGEAGVEGLVAEGAVAAVAVEAGEADATARHVEVDVPVAVVVARSGAAGEDAHGFLVVDREGIDPGRGGHVGEGRLGVACDEQGETGTERKQDVAKSDRPGGPGRSRGVSPNPRFAHAPFLHGASSRGQHREIP